MDQADSHPGQPQQSEAVFSEVRQQYCQLLVNSLISPHLDTSKPDLNAKLLRVFEEVLGNAETRVKAIFDRCHQAGEATAAEPEKCVEDFGKRVHYIEEYLSACFQTRNVNYVYSNVEMEEPITCGPEWRTAHRAMARIRKQLHEDLDVQNSALLDGLVRDKLVRDWERDSILARPTPRAKAQELLRTVTPRLNQTRLLEQFIPLLRVDHEHLAEGLSRAVEEEEETGGSEVKCCVCQLHEVVEVKRLVEPLSEVVSPSLESDLSNPALSNASKMHQLKEEVSPEQVIGSLRDTYPGLHQQFCSGRVTTLECFCARLREAPTSDVLDDLRILSVTEDYDVAQMSDLQSLLGEVDLKEQAYHLGSETRGICLIINNSNFNGYLPQRAGTEFDVKKMSEFFTQLHFSVVICEDLGGEQMTNKLKDIALMDHSKHDCFVCFVSTNGGQSDELRGTDGSTLKVRDVVSIFHSDNCISLAGKPKVFLFQASRGDCQPTPLIPKSAEDGICPPDADIFIGFPSSEGHASFRNQHQGSWYVYALIEVLSKYGDQYDFHTCMTMVTQLVASRRAHLGYSPPSCQTPQSVSTLRKPLFLSQNPVMTRPAPKFDAPVENTW